MKYKYTCLACGNIFYFSDNDQIKNAANLMMGNIYTLNQVKNLGKCPKCGSEAVSKKRCFFGLIKKETALTWKSKLSEKVTLKICGNPLTARKKYGSIQRLM